MLIANLNIACIQKCPPSLLFSSGFLNIVVDWVKDIILEISAPVGLQMHVVAASVVVKCSSLHKLLKQLVNLFTVEYKAS